MSDDSSTDKLAATNDLLAHWAARAATDSAALIDRFEALGYAVRGKSEDEIAEILRRPPERDGAPGAGAAPTP